MIQTTDLRSQVATILQQEYDEAWSVFHERHKAVCSFVGHHRPEDLIGNLDMCAQLDNDAEGNFAYGTLLTVRHLASETGIDLHMPMARVH